MVCICFLTLTVDVSIMVAGIFLVVNADGISIVVLFSEGWVSFLVASVVSLAVVLKEVSAGSAIKGIGHLVIPAVTL